MRVPLSWLREYVDFDLEPEKLAERLTMLGMEVQGIERRGSDWQGIVVGELTAVERHPGSEKLLLTKARLGDGSADLSIVTGATNIAVGQRVPVAAPGAVLPGGRRIEVATLAGTESQGMLCSGAELGISADADGILVLPDEAPVGATVSELYGDVVLDIDVKPNRGDLLSLVGVAREVAAITGGEVRFPPTEPAESGDATADHLQVEVVDRALCPRFVGRYLDRVTVRPSPFDVQLRLTAAGQRPVSNVVDATNYVMLELGKPTHAFDADRIAEGRIIVRPAAPGERLETLDHVVRELSPDTLLIADPRGPLAIAGIMGGAESEVDDGTTAVVIESAIFDPIAIRRTRQHYGLASEASQRFEKGQEWRLARLGADRAARLVADWSGARVARGAVDTDPSEPEPSRVAFRPRRISRLLGAAIEADEMRDLMGRVGIESEVAGSRVAVPVVPDEPPIPAEDDALVATVPGHRRDLVIEADIAEEVARVRGYDTVPARRPETPMPPYRPDPRRLVDELRELLSGRGLSEVVCHALVGPEDHERLGIDPGDPATIRVSNPVSVEHSQLRRSLVPGLVRTIATNERSRRDSFAIFEFGRVHEWIDGQPVERERLGIALAGPWQLAAWDLGARTADAADAKGIVQWLADRAGLGPVRYEAADVRNGVEHPGRTARVLVESGQGAIELGRVGELDPRYLEAYEVRVERVAFADLDVATLGDLVPERIRMPSPPRLPPVERDLAVVVGEDRPAAEVEAVIREAAGALLRELRLFDRYQGKPLGSEEVSLAYRLSLQAEDRTLTDEEVDELLARVVATLEERLGARLRA